MSVIYVDEWLAKSGKKKNQMESLPARGLRVNKVLRESKPDYDTALEEQKAERDMDIYRKAQLDLAAI